MSEEIKVGDVVVLKSGGQFMTVEAIDEYGNASCVWADGKTILRNTFNFKTLALAEY